MDSFICPAPKLHHISFNMFRKWKNKCEVSALSVAPQQTSESERIHQVSVNCNELKISCLFSQCEERPSPDLFPTSSEALTECSYIL